MRVPFSITSLLLQIVFYMCYSHWCTMSPWFGFLVIFLKEIKWTGCLTTGLLMTFVCYTAFWELKVQNLIAHVSGCQTWSAQALPGSMLEIILGNLTIPVLLKGLLQNGIRLMTWAPILNAWGCRLFSISSNISKCDLCLVTQHVWDLHFTVFKFVTAQYEVYDPQTSTIQIYNQKMSTAI